MKRIVVSGGAGFIGSHVVEKLLEDGWFVVVLDNFSTGKLGNLPVNNKHLHIINGSIADAGAVAAAMQGCEVVIHLAAIASVQASISEVVATHEINLTGTLVLLEEAKKVGVKHFLYASSAAVYGDASWGAVSEKDQVAPISPYAIDKLSGEYYLKFYLSNFGLPFTAFRFFNVYGPRQNPESQYSGVISKFVANALAGKTVMIYGDGNQTRDFIFVKDISSTLISAIDNSAMKGKIINLGRGIAVSLHELINNIRAITKKEIKIEYLPPRLGDIRHSLADVSVLKSLPSGSGPSTGLESGLEQTINFSKLP